VVLGRQRPQLHRDLRHRRAIGRGRRAGMRQRFGGFLLLGQQACGGVQVARGQRGVLSRQDIGEAQRGEQR
jgi:hypothetical protein